MTIKPIVLAATQKRVGVSTDASGSADNKESAHSSLDVVGSSSAGRSERRNELLYEEQARIQRNTHRSQSRNTRSKLQVTRERVDHSRDRLAAAAAATAVAVAAASAVPNANLVNVNRKLPEQSASVSTTTAQSVGTGALVKTVKNEEEECSGYNSGDEHQPPKDCTVGVEEWSQRDEQFINVMKERGFKVKNVEEDGACLFRAISLQIYGDEDMHDVIRQNTMDYIYKNREYFCNFVTEDINTYINRKRRNDSHGNHIEIQAMSEIYSRPVEVYCYAPTPINIFNSEQLDNGYAPLRLSYQRGSHYNAILDPYNATVGVGLGLAGYKPELQTKEAVRLSEQVEIEQTMFEDKLKTTDWEATNEAIEEQIARESYLQWCRDNLQRSRNHANATATVTSAQADWPSPSKNNNKRVSATITKDEVELPPDENNAQNENKDQAEICTSTDTNELDDNYDADVTEDDVNTVFGSNKRNNKRRREQIISPNCNESDASKEPALQPLTSPKTAKYGNSATANSAAHANDIPLLLDGATEQPSTSKQSASVEHINAVAATEKSKPMSNLYAELLEASFTVTHGSGSLSETEMLQRAIQLSKEDYLNDQKRKYFFNLNNNNNNEQNE